MAGTEIANAYVSLTTRMPNVAGDIKKDLGGPEATKALSSSGKSMGNILAGAIGGAVALAGVKAISALMSAVDGAIARVDMMNNFPKVMANLGYSSEDAAASIQKMSDRLSGLPTALDSMAGMVQQLAPLTGGLDEATELSLALNNALLAGGKSTDIQANAMEQYSQMLSIGTVDMAAFRSLVTAMPGQMNQLSEALLGTGSSAMDLYAAMKDGEVGFDDFNAAILTLNKDGIGAFASFEKQARSATDGIATSQANLNTAMTRGLASIIDRFAPQITSFLAGVTSGVNAAFATLGGAFDWIADNMEIVEPILAGVAAALAYLLVPALAAAAKATWAWTAALLASPTTWIVLGIAALVAALVWLVQNWDEVVAWITEVWDGFIVWITDVIDGFVGWWNDTWTAVGTFFTDTWDGFIGWVTDTWGGFVNWLFGIGDSIASWWNGLWSSISSFVTDTWTNIVSSVTGAFDSVATFIDDTLTAIQTAWENVWTGIGDFLKGIWNTIIGWIEGGVNAAIDLINGLTGGIRDVLALVGIEVGDIPSVSIPRLAEGGFIPATPGGTLAVIGEGRHDEVVLPLSPEILGQLGGGGGLGPGDSVVLMVDGEPFRAVVTRTVDGMLPGPMQSLSAMVP